MTHPESTHPLGPDAPREDHLGLAFSGLFLGVVLSIALNASVGFVVRTIQASRPPATALIVDDPAALTLFVGTLAACLAGAIATWRTMAPTRNPFRQGMFAMVSFFACFVTSLLSMGADRVAGRVGTATLAVIAFGAAWWLGRRISARVAS